MNYVEHFNVTLLPFAARTSLVTARTIMNRETMAVTPDTPIRELAQKLLESRMAAIPVLDHKGVFLGLVSEIDLIRRVELGTESQWSFCRRLITSNDRAASNYLKSHGRIAADVMSTDVVTAHEGLSLRELVERLEKSVTGVLPVLRNRILVGMVARVDLIRALSTLIQRRAQIERMKDVEEVSDSVMEDQLMEHVRGQPWAPKWAYVTVSNGVATLRGREPSRTVQRAFVVAAENLPGVNAVRQCFFREPIPATLRSERI